MPEVRNLSSPSWTYPAVKEILKALFNPAGFFGATLLHDLQTLELKNQKIYEFTRLFEMSLIAYLASKEGSGVFFKGVGIGLLNRSWETLALWSIRKVEERFFPKSPKTHTHIVTAINFSPANFRRCFSFLVPIIEEFYFRFFVQDSVKWAASRIFKKFEAKPLQLGLFKIDGEGLHAGNYILGAEKIGILASSIYFISVHNVSLVGGLIWLPGVLLQGHLANSQGILGPIAIHMTHNASDFIFFYFNSCSIKT